MAPIVDGDTSNMGHGSNPRMLAFMKVHPKALGAVQIMNGVVTLLLWITSSIFLFFTMTVTSTIVVCAALVYIITGCFTVRAETKPFLHKIKRSLAMNVISAVVAGTVIVVLIMLLLYGYRANACPTKMAALVDVNLNNGASAVTYASPSVPNQTAVSNVGNEPDPRMLAFLKVQPKSLGIVQIMNGVITLLLTIVLVCSRGFPMMPSIVCFSLIYIVAGALSIRVENRLHPHLIKNVLIINVISAVVAGITIVLLSLFGYSTSIEISGVLLVFCLLQFIISICISAFGCKATCCYEPVVQLVTVISSAPPCPPELIEYNGTTKNPSLWNHLHTVQ